MLVDETTRRHLELTGSTDGTRIGSLLSILDETLTPVGARTLSNWIVYPLMDLERSVRGTTPWTSCSIRTWAVKWRIRCGGSAIWSGWRAGSAACALRRATS